MVQTYAHKFPGGDGALSLHMVETFELGVSAFSNEVGTFGVLWIEVRFF